VNAIGYLTLLGYPIFTVSLFLLVTPTRAVIWTFLVGWLFLPLGEINIIGLPAYGKFTASSLLVLPCILVFDFPRIAIFRPAWTDLFLMGWLICPMISSVTNGLGAYDGLSGVITHTLTVGVPYFAGRLYLRSSEGSFLFQKSICNAALIYVPFCIVEMRMSPQFHSWIYGVSGRASWSYSGIFGPLGWTPTVFMNSAFEVALLMTMASLFSCWGWLSENKRVAKVKRLQLFGIMTGMVVLCKKMTGLGLCSLGLAMITSRSRIVYGICLSIPLAYVFCFSSGLWRGEGIKEWVALLSVERAASLEYRLINDRQLVERALQRPSFGWGGWGRSRIYDEEGRDVSVTDSMFLITLGTLGFMGCVSQMGLYLTPAARFLFSRLMVDPHRRLKVSSEWVLPFGAILILHSIDNLFNAFPNTIYPIIAGGLASLSMQIERPA
jgi:hypothetical protein